MKKLLTTFFSEKMSFVRKIIILAVAFLCSCLVFSLFFTPFCFYPKLIESESVPTEISAILLPWHAFELASQITPSVANLPILGIVLFVIVLISVVVSICFFAISVVKFLRVDERKLESFVKRPIFFTLALTGLYFVGSILLPILSRASGANIFMATSFVPFILTIILSLLFACFCGLSRYSQSNESALTGISPQEEENVVKNKKAKDRKIFFIKLELLICVITTALLAVIASLTNILDVTFTSGNVDFHSISINGLDFFNNYSTLTQGGQVLTFILFVLLTIIFSSFFLCLFAFLSRSKTYSKLSLASIILSVTSSLLIGTYGKYYQIVQTLNDEMILSLLNGLIGSSSTPYTYTVTSHSLFYFIGALVIVGIMFFRRPYSKLYELTQDLPLEVNGSQKISGQIKITELPEEALGATGVPAADGSVEPKILYADPCPAFTELDDKEELFAATLQEQRLSLFEEPTLPKLVQFIVNYARDSRLHLSYSPEDIATFIAGLGTTKLTILQGMSGTGKTSLPKIFTEALMSRCDIIEVESSWRDKNELLGYYNEFSKTFTPKKFTQALYRAKLNPETITFIVLDEMNLSRIEYYFSDFLSLMENEPQYRELKLLNTPLYRIEKGNHVAYHGLTDGHTLKIPSNVWFIGTANRDESTFEISDKVYDRAHTMNFNKRAPKISFFNDPIAKQFLPSNTLDQLFVKAKEEFKFDIDAYKEIGEVEKLLAPYNISFGNRIAMQIESFVSIYCSCFNVNEQVIHSAVETILLSKVVAKLELKSVENKEQLASEFAKLGFEKCSAFISKLNED